MTMLSPFKDVRPDVAALVRPIERAIKNDRATGLAEVLADLDAAGLLDNPNLFAEPRPDRYSRRLVWLDPEERFVIVGMTWGPGQGSPLHDHSGLWGAEIVISGTMADIPYELVDRDPGGRYQFVRGTERRCEKGTIGVLIPPLEYHEFGNSGESVARTFHVYGGNLTTSQAFAPDGRWWNARRVDLRYDA